MPMWVLNLSDLQWEIRGILGGPVCENCWPLEEKFCCKKITFLCMCGIGMVKVGCECTVVLFGGRHRWRSNVGGFGRWSTWEKRWTKTLIWVSILGGKGHQL